jgi:hypothetical protein
MANAVGRCGFAPEPCGDHQSDGDEADWKKVLIDVDLGEPIINEPAVDRDPFEVVAASFLARCRPGERPSIEEGAARYPELTDQIHELLPALVKVEAP